MLSEQAAAKGQRAKKPWELFRNPAVRWQLISIIVLSSAMQLCGNDSVSCWGLQQSAAALYGPWVQALGFNTLPAEEGAVFCSASADLAAEGVNKVVKEELWEKLNWSI